MINIYYSYRFNPIKRYYEVLEHIPDLERVVIVYQGWDESEVLKWIYAAERQVEQFQPEETYIVY